MKALELPDKPSELIMVALGDLVKVMSDPNYRIDMEMWHQPRHGSCMVCLAGAVIAKSLNKDSADCWKPTDFPLQNKYKLNFLNAARLGSVEGALGWLGLRLPIGVNPRVGVAEYEDDPEEFIQDMTNLANDLAKAGL